MNLKTLAAIGLIAGLLIFLTLNMFLIDNSQKTEPVTEQEVLNAVYKYHEAWEALDFKTINAWNSPDFEYIFFEQRFNVYSFESVLESVWMKGVSSYQIDEFEPSILILSNHTAAVSFLVKDRSIVDGQVVDTSGAMSYIFKRIGDTMKIVRIHHSGASQGEYQPL